VGLDEVLFPLVAQDTLSQGNGHLLDSRPKITGEIVDLSGAVPAYVVKLLGRLMDHQAGNLEGMTAAGAHRLARRGRLAKFLKPLLVKDFEFVFGVHLAVSTFVLTAEDLDRHYR
jgi:hypothetical protein